jgi:hypothetical protein
LAEGLVALAQRKSMAAFPGYDGDVTTPLQGEETMVHPKESKEPPLDRCFDGKMITFNHRGADSFYLPALRSQHCSLFRTADAKESGRHNLKIYTRATNTRDPNIKIPLHLSQFPFSLIRPKGKYKQRSAREKRSNADDRST